VPIQVIRPLLAIVNIAGGLLLAGMTDVDSSKRLLIGAVLVGNVLLLLGKRALAKTPARLGASASPIGYAGAIISWLVLALGCGIEIADGLNIQPAPGRPRDLVSL
jgi:hypothetical protein